MDHLACNRCGTSRDIADNFCRKCGHQLTITMPVASRPSLPVAAIKSVSIPPAVVRGVAVLALSTGVEWAMRRVAGNAARAAGRALVPGAGNAKALGKSTTQDVSVDEIVYIRKVQLRR